MRRGQTALEFLMTFSAAALIFVVFSVYIANQFTFMFNVSYGKDTAQNLAELVAAEADRAYLAGDGYHSTFSMPEVILGQNFSYAVNPETRAIEVHMDNHPERWGSARHFTQSLVITGLGAENAVSNSNGTVVVRAVE